MSHSYTEFFYHYAWATKKREPYVGPELEPAVYGYIGKRCEDMGVFVYVINGMPDHIHVVCSIPPKLPVAEVLDKLKGGSSHYINHLPEKPILYWQEGYGGLTFAKRDLRRVIAYVQNQKSHHSAGPLWPTLERFGEEAKPIVTRARGQDSRGSAATPDTRDTRVSQDSQV